MIARRRMISCAAVLIAAICMACLFGLVHSEAASKPGKVLGLKVSAVSYDQAAVSWKAAKNASGYRIYVSSRKSSGYKCVKTVSSKVHKTTITKLKEKRTYYIKVRAFKKYKKNKKTRYSYGSYSRVVTAKTRKKNTISVEYRPENHIEMVDQLYDGSNIAVSELSLNMALGMLTNGAKDNSLSQLEDYFGLSLNKMNRYSRQAISCYNDCRQVKVALADSIWMNKTSFTADKEFIKAAKTAYDAEVRSLDFNDKGTADAINSWCRDKTRGLIPNIVEAEDLKDSEIALLNSLYFKGSWEIPYDSFDILKKQKFSNMDGSTGKVSMLCSEESIYLENEKATGVMKSYRDGLYFVGILPKEKGEFDLSGLDIEGLIASQTSKYKVNLKMPEFNISSTIDLSDYLKSAGVSDIFSEDLSRLQGMGKSKSGSNFYVSLVRQKTAVKLNRYGTEAAAVTAIISKATALPGEEDNIRNVTLDRPFAFLIYDRKNNIILFEGKVVDL